MIQKRAQWIVPVLLLFVSSSGVHPPSADTEQSSSSKEINQSLSYPETEKKDVVDNYHETKVPDPYRWLEDLNDADTQKWIEQQNELTFDYLRDIPFRETLRNDVRNSYDFEKYSAPRKEGGRYFFFKNSGLQEQKILYMQENLNAEPEVLLDPNDMSEDGTVSISGLRFSRKGRYMAYSVHRGGTDWAEIRVMDLKNQQTLDDRITGVKFGGAAWHGNGFYYSRFPKPEKNQNNISTRNVHQKVYYHKLGDPQSEDRLVHEDPDHPKRSFYAQTSENEQFLFLMENAHGMDGTRVYVRSLNPSENERSFVPIVDGYDNDVRPIGVHDGFIYLITNDQAPNSRIVRVPSAQPERQKARETIVPEQSFPIQNADLVGGHLLVRYLEDARTKVYKYSPNGTRQGTVELPGTGTARGFSGAMDDSELFYTFESFTQPTSVYRYDLDTDSSHRFHQPEIELDPSEFTTKQVRYRSKDGTKIPMFITHRKGMSLDGNRPTLLYGYGGFDISLSPTFNILQYLWLKRGGVYAQPSLRGGGEYGEEWHEAGMLENKQNVFDDFIAAAEYLTEQHYTRPERLTIAGSSNGGLLVGAVLTQRPDLFGAALPSRGVLDMLRYQNFSIGHAWVSEYGSSENPKQFEYLYEYSPYHNVEPDTDYPATLVTTAKMDDRVVPSHSYKFTARLQAHQSGADPVLIRVETKAGHGSGTAISKEIRETTDRLSFAWFNIGFSPYR